MTDLEPDETTITREGPFVRVVQTFHTPTSIEIRLDLWPAEDDEDDPQGHETETE